MDPKWNEDLPIYRQLRDRVVAMILEEVLGDGDALPSVRNVAAEYRLIPLTVLKGYQELVDEGLVEKKRGRGMFVTDGARNQLLKDERERFLDGLELLETEGVGLVVLQPTQETLLASTNRIDVPGGDQHRAAFPREVGEASGCPAWPTPFARSSRRSVPVENTIQGTARPVPVLPGLGCLGLPA